MASLLFSSYWERLDNEKQEALRLLKNYEQDRVRFCRVGSSKQETCALIKQSLNDYVFNQGDHNICGASSFLSVLSKTQPLLFIEICIDIAEKGQYKNKEKIIKCPRIVFNKKIDILEAAQMAFKHTHNKIIGYYFRASNPETSNPFLKLWGWLKLFHEYLSGLTLPKTINKWLTIYGYKILCNNMVVKVKSKMMGKLLHLFGVSSAVSPVYNYNDVASIICENSINPFCAVIAYVSTTAIRFLSNSLSDNSALNYNYESQPDFCMGVEVGHYVRVCSIDSIILQNNVRGFKVIMETWGKIFTVNMTHLQMNDFFQGFIVAEKRNETPSSRLQI